MRKWGPSIVWGMLVLASAFVALYMWRMAIEEKTAAQLAAAQAERAAEVRDSVWAHNADSIAQVSKARKDSISALEAAASASRRRLNALSASIDSLIALGPGQVIELPADATALDSMTAVAGFWKARYEERTEAQQIAMQEADSLRLANTILHREQASLSELLAQAEERARLWKQSSDLWKAAAECRIPLIGVSCPSRTVVGVGSAILGMVIGR